MAELEIWKLYASWVLQMQIWSHYHFNFQKTLQSRKTKTTVFNTLYFSWIWKTSKKKKDDSMFSTNKHSHVNFHLMKDKALTLTCCGCTELMPSMFEGVLPGVWPPGWLLVMMAVGLPCPPPDCVVTSFTMVAPCGMFLPCTTRKQYFLYLHVHQKFISYHCVNIAEDTLPQVYINWLWEASNSAILTHPNFFYSINLGEFTAKLNTFIESKV